VIAGCYKPLTPDKAGCYNPKRQPSLDRSEDQTSETHWHKHRACMQNYFPSGKHTKNYGKSQFLMRKSAINI